MDFYEAALKKLGWEEVTIWYQDGNLNHLEKGHTKADRPKGAKEQNKAWQGKSWSKLFTYINKEHRVNP